MGKTMGQRGVPKPTIQRECPWAPWAHAFTIRWICCGQTIRMALQNPHVSKEVGNPHGLIVETQILKLASKNVHCLG